ncbi:hypothetical protein ACTA71_011442 [Dictyostelium dimigraforme]
MKELVYLSESLNLTTSNTHSLSTSYQIGLHQQSILVIDIFGILLSSIHSKPTCWKGFSKIKVLFPKNLNKLFATYLASQKLRILPSFTIKIYVDIEDSVPIIQTITTTANNNNSSEQ